jgi:hypothetical protein
MCLDVSNVRSPTQWNWDGDFIVHSPIIPASREVPGTGKRYETDIRGYIASRDNAVIRRAVGEIADGLSSTDRVFFSSHKEGSFDFRMRKVTEYLTERVRYARGKRGFDSWLFPEETLANRSGDCEDRAFLLASLLLSSGISSYVVRVALGKLYNQRTRESRDHVWVMYKNESGLWMLIEPLLHSEPARKKGEALRQKSARVPADTYEYVPYYVFNDSHLWSLKNNTIATSFLDYLNARQFWEEFDPEFAASVHNHIFDLALNQLGWSDLMYVKGVSVAIDINPALYDPRDHFDNGYIAESWQGLNENLAKKTFDGLARACHTMGDFYAHSSYAHFAKKDAAGELVLFNGTLSDDQYARLPDYGCSDFDLHDVQRFTVNSVLCTMAKDGAIAYWNGKKLISGRFAQPGDPYQGSLEKLFISIPYHLRQQPDFAKRACLPHHNEIAVDGGLDSSGKIPAGHKLYQDPAIYAEQFQLRFNAAVNHIKQSYDIWSKAA